jgi:hypothetical protein
LIKKNKSHSILDYLEMGRAAFYLETVSPKWKVKK